MKFALSTTMALLAALGYADEGLKMTSATDTFKHKVVTHQNRLSAKVRQEDMAESDEDEDEDEKTMPPPTECFEWEFYITSDDCQYQWMDWNESCKAEPTDLCPGYNDLFYGQDLDWQKPDDMPDKECWYANLQSDDCEDQWASLAFQCSNYKGFLEDKSVAYLWTDDCDALIHWFLFEGYREEIMGEDDEPEEVLSRKMAKQAQKKQAAVTAGTDVKLLAQVAEPVQAAASEESSQRARNAAIVGGVSIAALGSIAACAFMKKSAKKSQTEEFLLQ